MHLNNPDALLGALPDLAEMQDGTPLTDRGYIFAPKQPHPPAQPHDNQGDITFHLDYLSLTVFGEWSELVQVVESALIHPAFPDVERCTNLGPQGRWEEVWAGPMGLRVMRSRPGQRCGAYLYLELKGEACAAYGDLVLCGFLRTLADGDNRWHATRLDFAWDGSACSPRLMRQAQKECRIVSQMPGHLFVAGDRSMGEGDSFYLGRKRRGATGKPARELLVYDARGFNRVELRLRAEWAAQAGRMLARTPRDEWVALGRSYLAASARVLPPGKHTASSRARSAPVSWWSRLLGSATPARLDRRPEPSFVPTPIGAADGAIQRAARALLRVVDALGPERGMAFILARAEHHARARMGPDDQAASDAFKDWIPWAEYNGMLALPEAHADPAPF